MENFNSSLLGEISRSNTYKKAVKLPEFHDQMLKSIGHRISGIQNKIERVCKGRAELGKNSAQVALYSLVYGLGDYGDQAAVYLISWLKDLGFFVYDHHVHEDYVIIYW